MTAITGQIKQDLEEQYHQLRKQVQVAQVSCHHHRFLWLWNTDPACWLRKKRITAFETKFMRKLLLHLLLGAQDLQLGAEQDQLSCGSTETSSGNCKETETCVIRAFHKPRQPLENRPSGHLGGWATPWSAEEMLYGQHLWVDIPAHARAAQKGPLQKKTGRGSLLSRPSCLFDDSIGQGTEVKWSEVRNVNGQAAGNVNVSGSRTEENEMSMAYLLNAACQLPRLR